MKVILQTIDELKKAQVKGFIRYKKGKKMSKLAEILRLVSSKLFRLGHRLSWLSAELDKRARISRQATRRK